MNEVRQEIILTLGTIGEKIGITLITLVSVWDIMWAGGRNLFHYSICWKGILAIWLGIVLILTSKHIDKKLK